MDCRLWYECLVNIRLRGFGTNEMRTCVWDLGWYNIQVQGSIVIRQLGLGYSGTTPVVLGFEKLQGLEMNQMLWVGLEKEENIKKKESQRVQRIRRIPWIRTKGGFTPDPLQQISLSIISLIHQVRRSQRLYSDIYREK